jgi:hypothetical protein
MGWVDDKPSTNRTVAAAAAAAAAGVLILPRLRVLLLRMMKGGAACRVVRLCGRKWMDDGGEEAVESERSHWLDANGTITMPFGWAMGCST